MRHPVSYFAERSTVKFYKYVTVFRGKIFNHLQGLILFCVQHVIYDTGKLGQRLEL